MSVEAAPLASLDSIIEGVSQNGTSQGETAKPAEVKQETKEDGLDRIEREQKHRREQFRLQQRIKELEEQQEIQVIKPVQ
jgi:predicted secreted Zn-dependent protease